MANVLYPCFCLVRARQQQCSTRNNTSHGLALQPLREERSQRGALGNLRQQPRAECIYARAREILLLDLKRKRKRNTTEEQNTSRDNNGGGGESLGDRQATTTTSVGGAGGRLQLNGAVVGQAARCCLGFTAHDRVRIKAKPVAGLSCSPQIWSHVVEVAGEGAETTETS